jgi:hypothetical protein
LPGAFNERIAGSDARKAFRVFAAEMFAGQAGHVVFGYRPCDDAAGLKRVWKEVADQLWLHLSDPGSQQRSRFAQWYACGADAITGYRLATEALLADRSAIDAVEAEMRVFFQKLAALPHLGHLGAVDVAVVDWMGFVAELQSRPGLKFRWFPSTRPPGLMPFDGGGVAPPFRSFLSNRQLYYSRSAHALSFPEAASDTPPLEDDLLSLLDRHTGLIITGRGGVGMTSLTWELGARAQQNGWLVVRASATFGDEDVNALLSHLTSPGKALLLIDQIEAAESFPVRVEHLESLNAAGPHHIRYIANCRTSNYRRVAAIPNHAHVDVSPETGPFAAWLDGYRRAAVRSVLTRAKIEVTPANLQVCRDVPLFAVVMAFLRQRGVRRSDFSDFLADGDLGSWITKRIGRSFDRPVGGELAMLAAAFPMGEKERDALSGTMHELSERLAADGWIEKVTGGDGASRWVVVHDVLADCVILSHLEQPGTDTTRFIEALFDVAEANGAMAAVLAALQRIAGSAVLQKAEWPALFGKWLSRFTPQWLAVARFLYSALLTASEDHALIEEPLRRWLALHAETESAQFVSVAWLDAGGDRALVAEPLRRWLIRHAETDTAHFLYLAWLGAGGDLAAVDDPLRRWLARHTEAREAGPLFAAWLDAGGNPALIEELLRRWLVVHAEAEGAGIVYGAWLEAEGTRGVVEFPLVRWLTSHPEPETTGLSSAARLKRQRAFSFVRDAAFAAMARLRESAEGSYVSKALTKQDDLPDEAVLDILTWCRHFARNDDALWRLSQLEERIARPGVASEACHVAELLLDPWLDPASLPAPPIANNITRILASLTHITDPALRERAGVLLARWLRHPHGFDSSWCPPGCVSALVGEVRTLIARRVIDMAADAEAIDRFAHWKRKRQPAIRRTRGAAGR